MMRRRDMSVMAFLLVRSATCLAQLASPFATAAVPAAGIVQGHLAVVNHPYSLVSTSTTEKKKSDGSTGITSTEYHRFRDSAGRERFEVWRPVDGKLTIYNTLIFDPVQNTSTRLLPSARTAQVIHLRPASAEAWQGRASLRHGATESSPTLPRRCRRVPSGWERASSPVSLLQEYVM